MDTRWAYYELLTQDINDLDSGSAIPSTSREQFYGLPALVPPLPEQRAIAHILGTLDDKIELNRRMSDTLEAMARALFKSSFVDFDPVRAKMAGRDPGLPKHLSDLFPDRLVDSRVGKIPEGWSRLPLGDVLDTLETGKRPKGGVSDILGGVPSIGAESIVRAGVFDFSKTKYVPREYFESMKRGVVRDGDVIVYKDGGKPGELRPAVSYTSHTFPFPEFCINEHVFRVRSTFLSQQLLYCYLTTDDALWQMRELATGVAQPGLNQNALRSLHITMPSDPRILGPFRDRAGAMTDQCNVYAVEAWCFAQVRDTLIPRLTTGRLRVSQAVMHQPTRDE